MFIEQYIIDSYKPNKPNYRFIKKCIKHNRQYIKKTMEQPAHQQAKYFLVVGRKIGLFSGRYIYSAEWYEQAVDAWKCWNYLLKQHYEAKIIHTSYVNKWNNELWELGE